MKIKTYICLLIGLLVAVLPLQAKIYRINGNANAGADYTTIQAAHNAATAGDTLYIEGYSNYAGFTASKKLTYIGPGYFLGENPETQASAVPAKITGAIVLNSGAAGSVLTGIYSTYSLQIKANNIVVKRSLLEYQSVYSVQIGDSVSNIILKQNYINSSAAVEIKVNCHNIYISNCYIGSSAWAVCITSSSLISDCIVDHCVLAGGVGAYNSLFTNNIYQVGSATLSQCNYMNNIANSTQFGTLNGNKQNIDMNTVFVGSTGNSTDGQWQLKAGSPAIGVDGEGGDCGMFGGTAPYVLSGVPAELPVIYYFYNSGEGTNLSGLPVRVKAKVRN
jgi:hypothetical protein